MGVLKSFLRFPAPAQLNEMDLSLKLLYRAELGNARFSLGCLRQ